MNRQMARTLTQFFPLWWRKSYAEELCVFLEDTNIGALSIARDAYSTIGEHLVRATLRASSAVCIRASRCILTDGIAVSE